MHHVVLLPDDFVGPGIADETRHPGNPLGILAVHPMAQAFVNLHLMDIPAGILAGQAIEFGTSFGGNPVAVVGRVVAAHENGEGQVPEPQERGLVGMTRHHGSRSEPVGHARGQLPDTVAASGVAHQVHAVRTHATHGDVIVDEALEHRVDVPLMPQVPGVGRGSRREVESLGGFIQADLVLPLLVVHLLRRAAATVHGNPQAPLPDRGFAKLFLQPAEGLALEHQFLLVDFRSPIGRQFGEAVGGHHGQHPLGVDLGKRLGQHRGIGRTPVGRKIQPFAQGIHDGRSRCEIDPSGIDRGISLGQRSKGHFTNIGTHREAQPSLRPRGQTETRHVVQVSGAGLGVGQGAGSPHPIKDADLGRKACSARTVPQTHAQRGNDHRSGIGLGITRGHVDRRDVGAVAGPNHRKGRPLALPGSRINGIARLIGTGL